MSKKLFSTALISAFLILPNLAAAQDLELLQMPINAPSYVVIDAVSGKTVLEKDADLPLTAASLTKVVTALVVLDAKPKLDKSIAITKYDQTLGECTHGGGCIKAKAGVKFTVDGLFHAALLPSANNAASALARSTGLSTKQFAAKMNAKAKALGATHSKFYEPTGMNRKNLISASDYAKIMTAAFSNPYLREIAQKSTYDLVSTNNAKYNQAIKNTDKLLTNPDFTVLGAKTGYLDKYNFAAVLKYKNGAEFSIVVLKEDHLYSAFADAEELANQAQTRMDLAVGDTSQIAINPAP